MIFPAFRHLNFRYFFLGQGISLIGTWMQSVATSWLVFRLTESPTLLGLTGFSSMIFTFLLSPFTGALTEGRDLKKILYWTQSLAFLQAFILAILIYSGVVEIWHIIVLNLFLGAIGAFDMPTRQVLALHLVSGHKEDLQSAISLNSTLVNIARVIGPSIAGILISQFGEAICFFLNALSYLFALLAIYLMRMASTSDHTVVVKSFQKFWQNFQEGLHFVYQSPLIFHSLMTLAVTSFAGLSYLTLLPYFAMKVFHGDAQTLAMLTSASALGAFITGFFLAGRKSSENLPLFISIGKLTMIIGLTFFAFSHTYLISLTLLIAIGAGSLAQISAVNTLIQLTTDNRYRSRVMSLYTLAFMGMSPLGSAMIGLLADLITPSYAIFVCAFICFISWLKFIVVIKNHDEKKVALDLLNSEKLR